MVCSACHSDFVKSMSFQVPQFAILPGGAMYRIIPDHDMMIVDITSENVIKLLRLKPLFFSAMII